MTMSTGTPSSLGLGIENARILIVDDEDANLMVLRKMLERAGYTNLQTINDSSLAVERFVSFEPDLLVLDLHMPTPDGFEVMAQIEPLVAADSYVPILVLTADITESTRERALAVGARDFLTKPFRYTELLLRINNLLETRALHTQLHRDKAILEARMRDQQNDDRAQAERRRAAGRGWLGRGVGRLVKLPSCRSPCLREFEWAPPGRTQARVAISTLGSAALGCPAI